MHDDDDDDLGKGALGLLRDYEQSEIDPLTRGLSRSARKALDAAVELSEAGGSLVLILTDKIGQELLDAGLVARKTTSGGRVLYRLTWSGRTWREASQPRGPGR